MMKREARASMIFSGNFRRERPQVLSVLVRLPLALALAAALLCGVFGRLAQVHAQAIITTVNGNPITDLDLGQRMKLLHVLRKPASRDAALQSLINDQLRLQEMALYQVKPTDAEIGQQIVRTANDMKISPDALLGELQRSGVSQAHFKEHFSAVSGFDGLMQAFHKGVEPSETQVRAELAKEGSKATANTEYRIHQVIFIVPSSANSLAAVKGRMEAAQQLRARFSDCASGLPLARGMDNVAVKDELVRNSAQLSAPLKALLEKTETGRLTAPQRTPEGIEMIAVCSKGASTDDSAIRAAISAKLLYVEMEAAAEKRLKVLRADAVIVKK
jgi:peptidyl-prolyl cis-trans isomerase SurA